MKPDSTEPDRARWPGGLLGSERVREATAVSGARGVLRISEFGSEPTAADPHRHVTTLVPGRGYDGMEDADVRGFLDGGYSWPWNQAGQIHVRVGRLGRAEVRDPQFGEQELFRTLQRWDGIRLPPHTRVHAATLALSVHESSPQRLRVLLYEVKKDWDPGEGGVRGDDLSPPSDGEVWWLDAEYRRRAWALPGVGYASADDRDADADVMALAEAIYEPGDDRISFSGPAFADYVSGRLAEGEPLLLLLKVADHQEDLPGLRLSLYSAEYGESGADRRPRLTLEWASRAEARCIEHSVHLEYGRRWTSPTMEAEAGRICAVTFIPESGYEPPTLEYAAGPAISADATDSASDWQNAFQPFTASSGRFRVRVSALRNAVRLGRPFVAEFRDNWVVTAPAEDQVVLWRFVSPTGRTHQTRARYLGQFRWRVEFVPDELGRWQHQWVHSFYMHEQAESSAVASFDVVPGSPAEVSDRLRVLAREAEAARRAKDHAVLERLSIAFHALQRAAVQLEGVSGYRDGGGERLRSETNAVRSAFSGREVPDRFPMRAQKLCSTLDGRVLRDPIPRTSLLRGADRRDGRGGMIARARRLIGKLTRLAPVSALVRTHTTNPTTSRTRNSTDGERSSLE